MQNFIDDCWTTYGLLKNPNFLRENYLEFIPISFYPMVNNLNQRGNSAYFQLNHK